MRDDVIFFLYDVTRILDLILCHNNKVCEYCIFISDDVIVSLLTALPPSKATLRNVFENTRDLNELCFYLYIPWDHSERGAFSSEWDVDSTVEYYAQDTDQMKMRNMIWIQDCMGDTALADSVMEFAELPAGMATQYNREHNTSLACNMCVCL